MQAKCISSGQAVFLSGNLQTSSVLSSFSYMSQLKTNQQENTYWKSNYRHICLCGFNKEVHPEVHEFLFGCMLFRIQFFKMLIYQNSLYNRLQVPVINNTVCK